jgi:hypothetical protein
MKPLWFAAAKQEQGSFQTADARKRKALAALDQEHWVRGSFENEQETLTFSSRFSPNSNTQYISRDTITEHISFQ